MARFGGNEFTQFSVPLVFRRRYFVLEPGTPPLLSVFLEEGGASVFEVLKNEPVQNPLSEVTKSPVGIVTVAESRGGRFLYKVRPGSETSIAFGRIDGGELAARISDTSIQVGGITVKNSVFNGVMAGVVVDDDGGVAIGAPLPPAVVKLLKSS